MPTVSNGYCTEEELRGQFGDAGSKLDQDTLIRAINATSRAIDKHCGRKFWLDTSATVRRYVTDDPLVAWVADIGSTTGLVIQTDSNGDGTWATTWASTDYELHPLDADLEGADAYSWTKIVAIDRYEFETVTGIAAARSNLKVTAKHGWSAIPDAVNQACIIRAASIFKRREAIFGVAGFGQFGDVRITRKDPDVLELLHPYIRISARAV